MTADRLVCAPIFSNRASSTAVAGFEQGICPVRDSRAGLLWCLQQACDGTIPRSEHATAHCASISETAIASIASKCPNVFTTYIHTNALAPAEAYLPLS